MTRPLFIGHFPLVRGWPCSPQSQFVLKPLGKLKDVTGGALIAFYRLLHELTYGDLECRKQFHSVTVPDLDRSEDLLKRDFSEAPG